MLSTVKYVPYKLGINCSYYALCYIFLKLFMSHERPEN